MTKEEFFAHRAQLEDFVRLTHQSTALIVVITFAAYALAGYLWWLGDSLVALLIATLGYLFFRSFRVISLQLARWRLASREGSASTLELLTRELAQRRAQVVMSEIEAYTDEAKQSGDG